MRQSAEKNKNDKRFPVSENLLTNQKMVVIIETKSIRRLDMVERKEYLKNSKCGKTNKL